MKNFKPEYKTRIVEKVGITMKYAAEYFRPSHPDLAYGDANWFGIRPLVSVIVPEQWVPFVTAEYNLDYPGIVQCKAIFNTLEEAKNFINLRTHEAKVVWESE